MIKTNCKLVPINTPSAELTPEIVGWISLLNTRSVPVADNDILLGFTVPGSVVVCDGFLCGDIAWTFCDFPLYEWVNADVSFVKDGITRFNAIYYKRKTEDKNE